jgi:arylsulfatase A-like enzyme
VCPSTDLGTITQPVIPIGSLRTAMSFGRVVTRILPVALLTLPLISCSGSPPDSVVLTADLPLHLEDHLETATIEGSELPEELPESIEWRFDEPNHGWKAPAHRNPFIPPLELTQTEDALRITLTEEHRDPRVDRLHGDIYVSLPDLTRGDWGQLVVRARASGNIRRLVLAFNLGDPNLPDPAQQGMFQFGGDEVLVINDGTVQTYVLRIDFLQDDDGDWKDPWRELGLIVNAAEPASLDLLSLSLIPKETLYGASPVGRRNVKRAEATRRSLFTHAPGSISYDVRLPERSRLNLGLGVLRQDAPVTFRVLARSRDAEPETLLEESYSDHESWAQRAVDLSHLAGQTVRLTLEAEADRPGTVALWAAPTLSGTRATDKPNVMLYIIDAGGADYMSLYGYNRPTTPNLDRLAREGAVFETAYSNSVWSKPSTPSFATSLHHSVLGGYRTDSDPIPDEAVTMAERLHGAGYQTAVITSNAYAGAMSSLDRGADALRDAGAEPNSTSTLELHDDYWRWREAFPGEPYFVHFQTTDVHWPWNPVAPFAGTFVDPRTREQYYEWERQVAAAAGRPRPRWLAHESYPDSAYEKAGIDRQAFFDAARGLYDETMAHNDYQLGRLVERLKARGEWEHTLLIVAADHSNTHGLGVFDSIPPHLPNFNSYQSRIPLLIIWPERIRGGQRFRQPVSMIDVLPTILDLVGLPAADVAMGQSLAPLLLNEAGFEPRPVIFDEFYVDVDTGDLEGNIEMIDGRWGASLSIELDEEEGDGEGESEKEEAAEEPEAEPDRPRLLLYDLWSDPYSLRSLHEERPDLVEKYTAFLEAQWEAHQTLARRFTPGGEVALTPEQLETLRSLGYIQ